MYATPCFEDVLDAALRTSGDGADMDAAGTARDAGRADRGTTPLPRGAWSTATFIFTRVRPARPPVTVRRPGVPEPPPVAPRAADPRTADPRTADSRAAATPERPARRLTKDQRAALDVFLDLGAALTPEFTRAELRSAFRALARAHHPDRHAPADGPERSRRFARLADAYRRLQGVA
ncbi:MAG: J domain-containing protein [Vicinamibacterales bacterium]